MPVTTQVFDPTLTSPFSQPIFYGSPGPYEHSGNKYWIVDLYDTGTNLLQIVCYKLSGGVFTKITTGFSNTNGQTVTVFWPGSGTVIYIGWVEAASGAGNLHATTFDMATETFGANNNSGVNVTVNSLMLVKIANGNWVFVYDSYQGGPVGRQVRFIVWNGATWSAPALISPGVGATTNELDTVVIDGAGNVGVFWDNLTNVFYTIIAGGVAGSATTALVIPANFQSSFPFSAIYDPLTDTVCWVVTYGAFGDRRIALLKGTPSATPSFTFTDVFDDVGNTFHWNQPILISDAVSHFDIFVPTQATGRMQHFTASSLAGPWTGPTVYYDQVAQPPTPAPAGIELLPIYARYLSDGSIGATTGMFYQIVSSSTFCGVLVYLAPVTVTQTLQLNKVVSGGPNMPSDWTLTGTGGSPVVTVSGPGPQVGPAQVPAALFQLSEAFGPTWGTITIPWGADATPWNGGYSSGNWVCTGGGSMPTPSSVLIPAGATIVCTITNTFPPPAPPAQPGNPCSGPTPPQPATDTQFELRRVYASMKPHPRLPVRGGTG